ncbi:MAG: prephenate dehydratase [Chloroflexota bacterium]|nr:prephenate dehydratase [Chloroflexota bacterium]
MARTIAYLGPVGTYTEEAALLYGPDNVLTPYPTISGIGLAVSSGETDQGVVPIENSLEGSVTYTLDLLITQSGLSICNEIVIPIEHYLMSLQGTIAKDIEVIYSHPQALAQCRIYLDANYPSAQRTASLSTVAAVTDMKNSNVPAAAIAPHRASVLHNVEIIGSDIQDNTNNLTRFVVLDKTDHASTGNDKTSICFSFDNDSPGSLYSTLGEFAERGINLNRVESRPTKESLGQYIFLIDCDGHREDTTVRNAIEGILSKVSMLKVLGSYPKWETSI